ncbi:hypothetical protein COCSUDRAFT_57239 [Coccomyxa subellipsoidea C-169]|uniref:Uncharacterized protein n=1 Tax=Coccomyxa subellipsoidea (strain C-169) TaxID=574566 RepID=I0YQK3_COCSC|nr:hypothetical protein COCSUDRAFT_57239 [Coccomyxa subellipsoidea C-169]EIE20672.1 hypothetical protein COCSUDRAFT_57239 [Coccomyxa subellipsoidea C-169]|eukprot:XP_005645216.1 hypothetical protein COCSUDRAFT_57239 [Coccomyxa subellipsoidea C-169]
MKREAEALMKPWLEPKIQWVAHLARSATEEPLAAAAMRRRPKPNLPVPFLFFDSNDDS